MWLSCLIDLACPMFVTVVTVPIPDSSRYSDPQTLHSDFLARVLCAPRSTHFHWPNSSAFTDVVMAVSMLSACSKFAAFVVSQYHHCREPSLLYVLRTLLRLVKYGNDGDSGKDEGHHNDDGGDGDAELEMTMRMEISTMTLARKDVGEETLGPLSTYTVNPEARSQKPSQLLIRSLNSKIHSSSELRPVASS